MTGCIFLDAAAVTAALPISSLHDHLNTFLPTVDVISPNRHRHSITPTSALLLMPSWSTKTLPYLGIKIVTYFPENSSRKHRLPGIHATYSLFSSSNGAPLASIDGTCLTLIRTAAISALAARYLAPLDSRTLIVVGAGALAPHLIRSHLFVRPSIRRVIIWNRTAEKARELAESFADWAEGVLFEHNHSLDDVVGLGDVVVCATSSDKAIVKGSLLKRRSHLNLLGSFTPSMRECDDEAMRRGMVFVDCEAAMEEAGELVTTKRSDVKGTLVDLVRAGKNVDEGDEAVTVFKSVGSAEFDLLAAQLAYENNMKG